MRTNTGIHPYAMYTRTTSLLLYSCTNDTSVQFQLDQLGSNRSGGRQVRLLRRNIGCVFEFDSAEFDSFDVASFEVDSFEFDSFEFDSDCSTWSLDSDWSSPEISPVPSDGTFILFHFI